MSLLKDLYNYRQMIFSMVKRDLRGRYKGTVLGFLWTFINPLLQLVVYNIVFSVILPSDIDQYYLHLLVALIPWLFLSNSVLVGTKCIIAQKDMVKKIYFPREIIPISCVLSNFVNMLLSFVIVFIFVIASGRPINFVAFLMLPVIMLQELLLTLGITLICAAVSVYFRDLEHIVSIVMMLMMYLSPIVYSISRVPERFLKIYALNPVTGIMIAYRDVLYYGRIPDFSSLLFSAALSVSLLIIGFLCFSKLKHRFAEEL